MARTRRLSTLVAGLLALAAAPPAQAQPQMYYPGWAAPPGYYGPRPQRPVAKPKPPAEPAAPVDATELINRGDNFVQRGEFDRAIEQYNRAIKGDAANLPEAYFRRGLVYSRKNDHRRAIAEFDEALKLDPNDTASLNGRCWERAMIGQLEQALEDCTTALKIKQDDGNLLDSRAFTYLKLERYDEAIADYDAAIALEPKVAGSLYGRGMAKLKKGDAAGSKADIAAARALRADVARDFAKYGIK